MPLNLFYTMVQKSQKWPKTQIKGGPALNYYGFDRSSQNASLGGEGLEKYNPGKSVCNRE